jgi:hypothetical protein
MMGPTTRWHTERWVSNLLRSARAEKGASQAQLAALAAVDLEMRIRLDDHDDVLDADHAAMNPEQQAATDARHDAQVAALTAAGSQ